MPICICISCSDTPLCTAQDVCYLPGPESVARMELWHEMAVAKVLVENISSLASCRKYIKLVLPVHRQLAHAPGRPVLVHVHCTHILVYLSLFLYYTYTCTTPTVHMYTCTPVHLYTYCTTPTLIQELKIVHAHLHMYSVPVQCTPVLRPPQYEYAQKMREKSESWVLDLTGADPNTTEGITKVLKMCTSYAPVLSACGQVRAKIPINGETNFL